AVQIHERSVARALSGSRRLPGVANGNDAPPARASSCSNSKLPRKMRGIIRFYAVIARLQKRIDAREIIRRASVLIRCAANRTIEKRELSSRTPNHDAGRDCVIFQRIAPCRRSKVRGKLPEYDLSDRTCHSGEMHAGFNKGGR